METMRKAPFIIGEYYHIYNRGTDKRLVFMDISDLMRFIQSMDEFNVLDPIGSILENKNKEKEFGNRITKLVEIVSYSLNPNHYHFILSPLVENGIEKFMQKLGIGFTRYFNEKYKRSGVLFQGKYKSIHINTDKYLMYLSAYINLNNKIHFLSHPESKVDKEKLFYKSSWKEYLGENKENFCNKSIVLGRYKTIDDYREFAESVAEGIIGRRIDEGIQLGEDLLMEKF